MKAMMKKPLLWYDYLRPSERMATMKKRPKLLLIDQHPEWLDFAQSVLRDEYDVAVSKSWENLLLTVKNSSRRVGKFD